MRACLAGNDRYAIGLSRFVTDTMIGFSREMYRYRAAKGRNDKQCTVHALAADNASLSGRQ